MTKQIKTYAYTYTIQGYEMIEDEKGKWVKKQDHDEIVKKLVEALKLARIPNFSKRELDFHIYEVLKEIGEL